MIRYNNITSTYTSSLLDTSIRHGFGTKQVGDGREQGTIESYLTAQEVQYDSLVMPKQTHSTNVTVVSSKNAITRIIPMPDTDALVTKDTGIILTVVTADCVPIIYADPVADIIAISHGGWKGTLGNIPARVIDQMEQEGAQRKNIVAAIGPSIGDCCYEVYGERLHQFQEVYGTQVITEQQGKTYLNLLKANYLLLQQEGIDSSQIDYVPFCTSCQHNRFWSYHRDKKIEGEMISYCVLS